MVALYGIGGASCWPSLVSPESCPDFWRWSLLRYLGIKSDRLLSRSSPISGQSETDVHDLGIARQERHYDTTGSGVISPSSDMERNSWTAKLLRGFAGLITRKRTLSWRWIMAVALLVRLISAAVFGNPYDFEIWRSTISVVYSLHVNTYFWWSQGPLALAGILASALPIPALEGIGVHLAVPLQNACLHLFFIAGDLVAGYALVQLLGGDGMPHASEWQKRTLLLWAALPGFWWIGAAFGQTDTWIPATALLGLVYLRRQRPVLAGIVLGLGAGIIYVPLVIAPTLAVYAVRRGGVRHGIILAITSSAVFGMSMIPLLLTDMHLGLRKGIDLFVQRNEWWSLATQNTVGAGQTGLSSVSSSPYPLLLAIAHYSTFLGRYVADLPLLSAVLAILVVPICYAAINSGIVARRLGVKEVDIALLACALTLLLAGGLSTQAVVQRLFWSLPLLLALAGRCRSGPALVVVCVYSWLYLLPEFYLTPPTFYLRGPFRAYAFNGAVAAVVGSWSGFGLLKQVAPIWGALTVPVGLLCIVFALASRKHAIPCAAAEPGPLIGKGRTLLYSGWTFLAGLGVLALFLIFRGPVYLEAVMGLALPATCGIMLAVLTFRESGERENLLRLGMEVVVILSAIVVAMAPLGVVISQWW